MFSIITIIAKVHTYKYVKVIMIMTSLLLIVMEEYSKSQYVPPMVYDMKNSYKPLTAAFKNNIKINMN